MSLGQEKGLGFVELSYHGVKVFFIFNYYFFSINYLFLVFLNCFDLLK
jgi:hypothetical protein